MWISRKEYEELLESIDALLIQTSEISNAVRNIELKINSIESQQASPEHFKTKEGLYNYKHRKPRKEEET
ncbi:MAG: hypothetical protein ACM3TR_09875 [Caulobacteraceae bacterium]